MKDHNENCILCLVTRKTFGPERFVNCASISKSMMDEAFEMMKAKTEALQNEVEAKFKAGELNESERDFVSENVKSSMAFAAVDLVALMTTDGPKFTPPSMFQLVHNKLSKIYKSMISEALSTRLNTDPNLN